MKLTALDIAREAWGANMPDWIEALAKACILTSQAQVARDLDRSGAVVSQVLRRIYSASTDRMEERVRGKYMAGEVICPALGHLPTDQCQDWREKASEFGYGSPLRARMYRACHRCPRFTTASKKEEA